METHEITIMIHSDIDPAQLLKLVKELGEDLAETIKTHGHLAVFHDEETSVTPAE